MEDAAAGPLGPTLAWLAVGVVALARAAARRSVRWALVAAAALVLATLARWRWHVPLYHGGREALWGLGVYAERLVVKAAFGVAIALVTAVVVWRGRRWLARARPAELALLLGVGAQLLLYGLLVASLKRILPGWLQGDAGRAAFDHACAALALGGALFAGRRRPIDDDD